MEMELSTFLAMTRDRFYPRIFLFGGQMTKIVPSHANNRGNLFRRATSKYRPDRTVESLPFFRTAKKYGGHEFGGPTLSLSFSPRHRPADPHVPRVFPPLFPVWEIRARHRLLRD